MPVGMYTMIDTTAVALPYENIGAIAWVFLYISAWASALLVLLVQGNAKASGCGMSNKYRLSRFFLVFIPHGGLRKLKFHLLWQEM